MDATISNPSAVLSYTFLPAVIISETAPFAGSCPLAGLAVWQVLPRGASLSRRAGWRSWVRACAACSCHACFGAVPVDHPSKIAAQPPARQLRRRDCKGHMSPATGSHNRYIPLIDHADPSCARCAHQSESGILPRSAPSLLPSASACGAIQRDDLRFP